MVKLNIRIRETDNKKVIVEIKSLSKKELLLASNNELITATEIHSALEALVAKLKEQTKEGE